MCFHGSWGSCNQVIVHVTACGCSYLQVEQPSEQPSEPLQTSAAMRIYSEYMYM